MGELLIGGTWSAWTLERPTVKFPSQWNAIRSGIYPVTIWNSARFKRLMPRVNVPDDPRVIEMHWGNWVQNSEGCILLGTMHDDNMLYNTREKFEELFPVIQAAVATEGCQIDVRDATEAD